MVDNYLSQYRASGRGSIALSDFRARVLNQANLRETTFSFTHAIFRSDALLSLPEAFRSNVFASQIELDTMFSFARIAEVWLKDKQPPANVYENQLGGQLLRFFKSQGWSLANKPDLSVINSISFDLAITALLNQTQGRLYRLYLPQEADLLLIYVLRNEAGHTPTSSNIINTRFSEIVTRVLFGLFTIAEKLF